MNNATKFCFQHHARWLEQGDGFEEHHDGSEVHTAPTSSGKIMRLDTKSWTAELVAAYFPPDDLLSKYQGSTQVLPSGNVLVNWGSEGALTEFKANGTPIFHAYVDSGYLDLGAENYRALRYNWTGITNEVPAIVALEGGEGTTIYVSWNGDMEAAAWRFYDVTGDEHGSRKLVCEVERTSFETSLLVTLQGR